MREITEKEVEAWMEGKFIPESMAEQNAIVKLLAEMNEEKITGVPRLARMKRTEQYKDIRDRR